MNSGPSVLQLSPAESGSLQPWWRGECRPGLWGWTSSPEPSSRPGAGGTASSPGHWSGQEKRSEFLEATLTQNQPHTNLSHAKSSTHLTIPPALPCERWPCWQVEITVRLMTPVWEKGLVKMGTNKRRKLPRRHKNRKYNWLDDSRSQQRLFTLILTAL